MVKMAENEKIMHFANFNVTFGSQVDPMLTHFEDIIFPAFTSGYKRGKIGERPLFYMADVEIKQIEGEYLLTGNYIKDMEYDVYTTVQDGELVSSPARVPTAPYSRFIIFLQNHRMVLVRNEPKSPDIRSFEATVRAMLGSYIRKINRNAKDKQSKLPNAIVNIVEIPLPKDIDAILKDVHKINWLKIRFFPLNNDISPIPIADDINKQMKKLGSKHAHVQFSSPDSKEEVKSLMDRSAGLAVSTLEVEDDNGNKSRIKEEKFTSSTKVPFRRDIQPDDDIYIVEQAKKDGAISVVSDENKKLYNRLKSVIERLKG